MLSCHWFKSFNWQFFFINWILDWIGLDWIWIESDCLGRINPTSVQNKKYTIKDKGQINQSALATPSQINPTSANL
jgi:hypothetical protein